MKSDRLGKLAVGVAMIAALVGPPLLGPDVVSAQQPTVVRLPLSAQNNSGQTGSAVLTGQGQRTLVVIQLGNSPAGPQPAHFHDGTCANLNPVPKYGLTPLANGRSETVVDQPIAALANGTLAINVHLSPQQAGVYVACGNVPNLAQAQGTIPVPAAAPAQLSVPQFGSPLGLDWPPVLSGELQVTIGNNTAIVGLVGNRTADQHAFVDVRWALPASVTFVDSFANAPQTNRGKFEGLSAQRNQVGWVNHFVRAGRVQGPFYIVLNNTSGHTFGSWSWMWFHTGGQFGSGRSQFNGNYTSSGVQTGAPFSWSGEFASAAAAAGTTGVPVAR